MSRQSSLPVLRQIEKENEAMISPIVPLNFVYPGISLSQIFSIIWGYWKVSTIIILIVLVLTIVILKIVPRTYEAEAALMVKYEVYDPQNGKELPAGQMYSYIATQIELVRNPELLASVVDQLQLTSNKDYAAGYTGKVGTLKQWVVHQVEKNLTVTQGQLGNQLIYVSFSANNPELAAKVANTIAETYKKRDDESVVSEPIERTARYTQKLSELKNNVEVAQQNLTAYSKQKKLIDGTKNVNLDMARLTTLENSLLDAEKQVSILEAHVSGDQSASDAVLASGEVQNLKAELARQEMKLAKMKRLYTSDYPDLKDLKASIEDTKQVLANTVRKYAENEEQKLTVAKELEKSLEIAVAKQRAKVLARGNLHDEAENYTLALQSAQAVYKRALDGYDELRYTEKSRNTNVNIVSHATPPLKYSKPKVVKGLILGAVAAFMLGLGIPMGYELFRRRVRCRDDLERDHGIPVLAELGTLSTRTTT